MKLLGLSLVRFGNFSGTTLDFGDGAGLFLVHGGNEAGKTTALHAVRALLFGIPVQARQYARGFDQAKLRIDAVIELHGGLRAELARTKGRKDTLHTRLLSGGGESVDEEWLNDKLGRPNKDLYNQVFAFSLDALADGAALLANDSVKGALYGAGFGGTVRPAEILARLEAEKDALFRERGTSPKINQTLAELAELAAKVRGAIRGSDVYEALEREWNGARQDASLAEAELARAQSARETLSDTLRALEVFEGRAADLRERDELAVPPRFDPTFAAAVVRAYADETRWEAELARDAAALEAQDAELSSLAPALTAAAELLAERSVILRLERSLDQQRALREESVALEASERSLAARASTELAQLRPGWTLDELAGAPFTEGRLARLRTLLERDRSLADTVRAATTAIEAAEEAMAREAALRAELPAPEPVDQLEAWVTASRALDDIVSQLGEAARAAAELERRELQLRAKLRPAPDVSKGKSIDALVPPTSEQIEAAREEHAGLAARLRVTTERRREADERLATAETALRGLETHGRAPSEAEVAALRAERDRLWRGLSEAIAAHRSSADVSRLPSGADLQRVSESIAAADRLADELRWRAEAVHQRARFEDDRAQATAIGQRLAREAEGLAAELATAERRWRGAWAELGLIPDAPEIMRAWRLAWDQLATVRQDRLPAEERVTMLREREATFVREGRALFGEEPAAPGETTLRTLRARAEARVLRARERERKRDELRRSELERKREHEQAEARRSRARAEHEQWREEWRTACTALGLTAPGPSGAETALSPEEARVIVDPLVALQRAFRSGQTQRASRRRELEEARLAFETEVRQRIVPLLVAGEMHEGRQEVADECARAMRPEELFALVERAHERFRRAESAFVRRGEIARLKSTMTESRAVAAAELASSRRILDEARAAATSDDEARIRMICGRARRAADLTASIEGADRELARLRGASEAEAFEEQLAGTSRAEIARAMSAADERIARLRSDVATLHQTSGALGEKRLAFDGGAEAAEREAEREATRSKLRDAVEAYAAAALAHEILQRNIKRFEREHRPRLLARTEELFGIMTEGAFVGVAQDLDRALVVERANGTLHHPDELSTGTAEQLFLALRLAYIEAYEAPGVEPLPVVLDDVLVNFDDARALATLRALVAFARRNQVIFFTCHAHLVALAEEAKLGLPVLTLFAQGGAAPGPEPGPLSLFAGTGAEGSSAERKSVASVALAKRRKKSG